MNKTGELSVAKKIAIVGIAAATVECGKLALSFLPNIEVVTLLLALYGYVFGFLGVAAAVVFVAIEPLIYGFGAWTVSYFIYWPTVALVFCMLGRARVRSRWVATGAAIALTLVFGVLTALVDVTFYMGITPNFFRNFALYYARGAVFYIVQLTGNAVLFFTTFRFLADKLGSVKKRMSS